MFRVLTIDKGLEGEGGTTMAQRLINKTFVDLSTMVLGEGSTDQGVTLEEEGVVSVITGPCPAVDLSPVSAAAVRGRPTAGLSNQRNEKISTREGTLTPLPHPHPAP